MRFFFRLLAVAGLLALAAAASGYLYLRQSLPRTSGELVLGGLRAEVEVRRDAEGVPHIYAQSVEDAHFALGFVHAQDRLWQMEMNRRIAAGRVAEILGPAALETDRFMRTLGVHRVAQANLAAYDAETRRQLDAYAAGVNAFIALEPVLPPEFWLLGVKPEPWTAADSVAWTRMMAWDLAGNWRNELLRMRLAPTLPVERIQDLLPPYPGDPVAALPDLKALYGTAEKPALQLSDLPLLADNEGQGSNSWVVSGAYTATGKPLLANDPHLGLTAPSVWYLARLHAPGLDTIGATLPGVPGVILGRNARIAWAFTNTGPDVQDLYLERLDGAGQYATPDGPRPFERRTERIRVKGQPDELLEVRISRHGPVVSDVSRAALEATPRGHVLAMAWTALASDDLTMQAALKLQRAGDWQAFLDAARELHAPQQTASYADVDGNIGFIAAGRVPVRRPDNDLRGLAPAPGWDARYDWTGYIPFDELPRAFNPRSGRIVSANHKIVDAGYPHHITLEWQPPFRARRIHDLLEAKPQQTREHFMRMQQDVLSLGMQSLLPFMQSTPPRSVAGRQALEQLKRWDGTMLEGRTEPLVAAAWWRELARAVYADELGAAFTGAWSSRAVFLANVLSDRDGQARWCDDARTRPLETCDELLAASLERALVDLRNRFGEDPARWSWGEAHRARHRHRPFTRQPWLARFFDISVPTPGDNYTVNVGRTDFNDGADPFASRHAASLRAVYDLADPESSVFIHSAGQSGNPLSPLYRNFAERWARGQYVAMRTARPQTEAVLRLRPGP